MMEAGTQTNILSTLNYDSSIMNIKQPSLPHTTKENITAILDHKSLPVSGVLNTTLFVGRL